MILVASQMLVAVRKMVKYSDGVKQMMIVGSMSIYRRRCAVLLDLREAKSELSWGKSGTARDHRKLAALMMQSFGRCTAIMKCLPFFGNVCKC